MMLTLWAFYLWKQPIVFVLIHCSKAQCGRVETKGLQLNEMDSKASANETSCPIIPSCSGLPLTIPQERRWLNGSRRQTQREPLDPRTIITRLCKRGVTANGKSFVYSKRMAGIWFNNSNI